MEPKQIAQGIWDQFVTVTQAPVPFLAALIASWFVMRWFIRGHFDTRLANAQSTIDMLEKQLDRLGTQEAAAAAAAPMTTAGEIKAPPPKPKARSSKKGASKTYVRDEHTPLHYIGMFEGRTEFLAQKMLEAEIGKWMRVTGIVAAVTPSAGDVMVALPIADMRMLFGYFAPDTPGLEKLHMGDSISFEGQIESIRPLGVTLIGCAFIG